MATTTDNSSIATPPPALRRVELRGFERVAALDDGASFKVAHVMLVRSQLDELVRHLPQALVLTFNKHPRMRARQVRGAFAVTEIQPPIALEAIVKSRLLGVRATNADEERLGKWQKHIEEESNVPFDRFSQFPFFLRVWVNKPAGTARLILFSDKVVSDAMSGTVVLHDVLAFASRLSLGSASLAKDKTELPLRPSLYNMWLDNLYSSGLTKFYVKWFAASGLKASLKTFTPLLEPRPDQNPMAMPPKSNATSVLFADGAPENLAKLQAACDREGVKIQSALAVAVLLGYYAAQPQAGKLQSPAAQPEGELEPEVTPTASKKVATSKPSKREPVKPFKLRMDALIDMRRRVEYPVQEVQVGDYTTAYTVGTFARKGVAVDSVKFWDLARANKHELDALLASYSLPAPLIFADQNLNSRTPPKFFKDVPLPRCATADVTLANLGSYIHASTHDFRAVDPETKQPTTAKLTVESLHVSCTSPHLTATAALFVTSVKALSFGIAHKYEDKTGRELFANLVALIESVGDVGADELLGDVVTRVLQQTKHVSGPTA